MSIASMRKSASMLASKKPLPMNVLEVRFTRMKKHYLRLRKGLLTQIYFYEQGTGPMPHDAAFDAVQEARDDLEECLSEILERQAPSKMEVRERKIAAKLARQRVA